VVKDVLAMSDAQNGGKIIFGVTAGRTSLKKYPPMVVSAMAWLQQVEPS